MNSKRFVSNLCKNAHNINYSKSSEIKSLSSTSSLDSSQSTKRQYSRKQATKQLSKGFIRDDQIMAIEEEEKGGEIPMPQMEESNISFSHSNTIQRNDCYISKECQPGRHPNLNDENNFFQQCQQKMDNGNPAKFLNSNNQQIKQSLITHTTKNNNDNILNNNQNDTISNQFSISSQVMGLNSKGNCNLQNNIFNNNLGMSNNNLSMNNSNFGMNNSLSSNNQYLNQQNNYQQYQLQATHLNNTILNSNYQQKSQPKTQMEYIYDAGINSQSIQGKLSKHGINLIERNLFNLREQQNQVSQTNPLPHNDNPQLKYTQINMPFNDPLLNYQQLQQQQQQQYTHNQSMTAYPSFQHLSNEQVEQSKVTQENKEIRQSKLKMEKELLIKINSAKHFFENQILKYLEKNEKGMKEYYQKLDELQKVVESSGQQINNFMNEFKDSKATRKCKKEKLLEQQYVTDLKDLHNLVVDTKKNIEYQGAYQSIETNAQLSAINIIDKIKSTKASLKKQLLNSSCQSDTLVKTKSPFRKRGPNRKRK